MPAPGRRTAPVRRQYADDGHQLTSREIRQRNEREHAARDAWARGQVVPHRITIALDFCELDGPGVDHACGVEEPAVDQWEEGTRYPTWEQLLALAELTGFDVRFFLMPEDGQIHAIGPGVMFVCKRSSRSWNPVVEIPAPIIAFTAEAVAATVGRYCVACLDPGAGGRAIHTCEQTTIPLEVG
jgi:hypothetical protein